MANFDNSSSVLVDAILTTDSDSKTHVDLHSYTERLILAMLCLFICIIGTVGNSSVFIAVLLSRKLQTPTNAFVVSLAITDLITSLLLIWNVVTLLSPNGWPLPDAIWLCVFTGYMSYNSLGISLLNLAAISVNRYVLITKPLKTYQKIYTPVNIGIMVAAIWIIPITISLSLKRIAWFGYYEKFYMCSEKTSNPHGEFVHTVLKIVFTLSVLTTVIISYTLVFRHVRRHSKKMRQQLNNAASSMQASSSRATTEQQTQSTTADTIPGPGTSGESSRRWQKTVNKQDIEITKNLLIVVIAFFLSFMPYAIIILFPGSESYHWYTTIFVFANSCMNPVIYARRHPHFKVVFEAMIKGQYQNIPEPSGILRRFISRRINANG